MKIPTRHNIHLKPLLLLSLMIIVNGNLLAQKSSSNEEKKILELLEESEQNWHKNIPKAKKAAKEAFGLIDNETSAPLKAEAFTQYGIVFYTNLDYDSAIYYYEKAVDIAISNNLEVYQYLATTTSAMEKIGRFMDVLEVVDKRIHKIEPQGDEYFNLLMMKLSAALALGLTEKSDSIIKALDNASLNISSPKSNNKFSVLKARYLHLTAKYEQSDSILNNLLDFYTELGNKMDMAEMYLLLAQNAMEISKYNKSSDLLLESKAIYDSLGYEFGQAHVALLTGSLLSWMGQYNDASDYIFEALEVFEKSNNRNQTMIAYYELGWIFYSMQMEERAIKYLNRSLAIARDISNIKYLGNIHNAYGSLFTDLEKYDSALNHFDSSILYQEMTQNFRSIGAAKFNKAIVLEKIGQSTQALELYRYSYKVDEKLSNTIGLIEGDWVLGKYFMRNNQLDSAQYYFKLGEKRAVELGEKYFLLKILEAQATIYSENENYQLASSYLKRALTTQKELSEENKTLELATLETTYDLKNKEKELSLLNLQTENNEKTIALNQQTIKSQRNTLILLTIGILILLILSYIIFRYLKIRTKTNHQLRSLYNEVQEKQEEIMAQSEELKEANDQFHELNQFLERRVKDRTLALEDALSELDHFFYRASHDFRGPLTTLLGLVEISKAYNLPQEATDLFNKVNITVKKLDGMVKKLQAVSFLGDFENLKSPRQIELEKDIKQIADEVIHNKSFDGIDYNCVLKIETGTKNVLFYPSILNICLSNLIENSLVFNYSDKILIDITATEKEGKFILTVQDNGIGISQDMQDEIFNMFKRTSQTSTGNGLGLYIVKKAVDQLNGEIQIQSDTRRGTTFTLIFPLSEIEKSTKEISQKLYISK